MITYSTNSQSDQKKFTDFAGLSRIIHVMTLVQPYVQQVYESDEQVAEQMGHCLDWFEKFTAKVDDDAFADYLLRNRDHGGRDLEELNHEIVRFWAGLLAPDGDLSDKDLSSFVYFFGCHLGFIQQLCEQQKEHGADEVASVMETALEELTPLVEFADEMNSENKEVRINVL